MSTEIYVVWAVIAPLAILSAWFLTRALKSSNIRVAIRSFVIAFACGFVAVGSDSAAVILPLWVPVVLHGNLVALRGIFILWIIVMVLSFLVRALNRKMLAKKSATTPEKSKE